MKKDISFAKLIFISAKINLTSCPFYNIVKLFLGILHGLSWGVSTYATAEFFNAVSDAVSGKGSKMHVYIRLALLATALIGSQLLNGIDNFLAGSYEEKAMCHFLMKLNKKAERIDPICFENKDLLDSITKANEGAEAICYMFNNITGMFIFYGSYFAFMGSFLYSIEPTLSLMLVIIFIPLMLTQIIRSKMFTKLADERAPIIRKFEYYEKCICDREYFKETRLLGAFTFFKKLYLQSLKSMGEKVWETESKIGLRELSVRLITLIGYVFVLFLLFKTLLKGKIEIGSFAAVFASIGLMFSIMEEVVCLRFGQIASTTGSAKNFIRFLELPERSGREIDINIGNGIELKNVSFTYPGMDKASLTNVNLSVKKGETIAIVGENGAGKTTLVRLMTGIFLPTEGDVFIDSNNTKDISPQSLYKKVSVVFQKYQKYKMTLENNITISDMQKEPNTENLAQAAEKADVDASAEIYPNGYETMLSREFDGIDLSGGQWQRVAIARGFYRLCDLIVLDEPTAAIDPIEETKLYNKFSELSKDKTAILVTHRLGSAKIADTIVVMEDGKIVETGTHDELIKGGKYAEMYKAQSKWYVNDTV